jgi:hypothetical protein
VSSLHALAGTLSASRTPAPTTISSSRFTIDYFNMTFALLSDQTKASVGAINNFNDGVYSLVTTAVLFKTPAIDPANPVAWQYRPTRVDMLFFQKAAQATRPVGLSDILLTLYSDDGSADHNPRANVRPLPSCRLSESLLRLAS